MGEGKDVLKGTRWLLLKNPENLNAERNELQHLEEALRLNILSERRLASDIESAKQEGCSRFSRELDISCEGFWHRFTRYYGKYVGNA